jgi:hypothetical protein
MLYNFREHNFPQLDEEDEELRLNDAIHIDDQIDIPTAITIFQYLKDRYYKNNNLHLTINKCIKGPIMSWMDYQHNYVDLIENLEQNITNPIAQPSTFLLFIS